MKLNIVMADPAGNRTAIVRTPVPAGKRAQIAAELLQVPSLCAEQAGFETVPLQGGAGRLEMMGGEFCGNAARSYGYLLWMEGRKGEQGPGRVRIEISGSPETLEVISDPRTGTAYAQMPLPDRIEYSPEGFPVVISEGISHMILRDMEPEDDLIRRLVSMYGDRWDAFGMMFLRGQTLTPVVYVKEAGSLVFESSCGSGSLAAAWYLDQAGQTDQEGRTDTAGQTGRADRLETAGRTDQEDRTEAGQTGWEGRTDTAGQAGEEGLTQVRQGSETFSTYSFREPGGDICVRIGRGLDGTMSARMGGAVTLEAVQQIEIACI